MGFAHLIKTNLPKHYFTHLSQDMIQDLYESYTYFLDWNSWNSKKGPQEDDIVAIAESILMSNLTVECWWRDGAGFSSAMQLTYYLDAFARVAASTIKYAKWLDMIGDAILDDLENLTREDSDIEQICQDPRKHIPALHIIRLAREYRRKYVVQPVA